ncbi:MAG: MFS transporter [Novosphingobium sp.]|nr:MFS transporter [Novosphingobium sp.]MCP5401004.1 MFS transporter [Novosphingobium sp.]
MNATPPTAAAEWRRHWPLVAASTSGMSLAALSTSAFGVMVVPIEQDIGWTRAQISSGPMLISVMTVCFGTLLGFVVDKVGPRLIALGNVTLLCGATALLSQIESEIWQWWATWIVIGLCSAILPTLCVMPTTRAFNLGRGLAMAIVLSGSGISSFIVPNLGNWLVEEYSWRHAYLYLAAIWYAVVFTLMLLFLRLPRGETTAAVAEQKQVPAEELPGLTAREAFTSAVFYKLAFAAVIANFVGIAIILNLIPILRWTELSPATAAQVASLIGIFTIAGRLISGGLIDRFDARIIAAAATLLMFAMPGMLLLFPGNVATSIAGVAIAGMMGGAQTPCLAYLASRHLGQRAYATLYATIMAAMSLGVGLGPLMANFVYDQTQSYNLVLWAALPMFAIGALLFMSLGPYPDFEKKEKDS